MFRKNLVILIPVLGIGCENSSDSLVGEAWTDIRPKYCQGETAYIDGKFEGHSGVVFTKNDKNYYIVKKGKPIFEYNPTEEQKEEKIERLRSKYTVIASVPLGIRDWKTEVLATPDPFSTVSCRRKGAKRQLLAVIPHDKVEASGAFHPRSAWKWDSETGEFRKIDDPASVDCEVEVQGDTPEKDWIASWPRLGWMNHACVAESD